MFIAKKPFWYKLFTLSLGVLVLFGVLMNISYAQDKIKKKKHTLNNHSKTNTYSNSENIIEFNKPPAGLLEDNIHAQYIQSIEKLINKNWHPPKGFKSKKTVVLFNINQQGELLKNEVVRSSGSIEADQKALLAVQTAAPFPPIPYDTNNKGVSIEFSFDFKAAYGNTKSFSIKQVVLNRHPCNPMKNHTYDPAVGHYYNLVAKELKSKNAPIKDFHFKTFPVKYWIQPMSQDKTTVIKLAIKDFSYYFPMQETKYKNNADLIFRMSTFAEVVSTSGGAGPNQKGIVACGGMESIYPKPRGVVLILPSLFNSRTAKGSVIHEMGHAFGIAGHSDNTNDIMFEGKSILNFKNRDYIVKNKVLQTIDEACNFTPRDLNTLWLIYNNW